MQISEYLQLVEKEIKNHGNFEDNADNLEVIQVWYNKCVQNHKGLFIVRNTKSNFIYNYFIEATYNGDAKELYLDFYSKKFKHTVKC